MHRKKLGIRISQYLLTNVGPYFVFSWLLLSVILFIQQASRYADIFFSVNIPKGLVFQLSFALLPSVIAFTCPMAILVGTVIGLSKMQGDSELTAIRAAGVGNLQITLPIAVLGILLSLFAFFINLKGVPFASGVVRSVALKTALVKLESPVEPGVFNTEINGYTIYVRDADAASGAWRNLFIYSEDKATGQARLITAGSGRIDSTVAGDGETAELVLDDASVLTFPVRAAAGEKVAGETLGTVRFAIKTRRDEILKRLTQSRETQEELGLGELAELSRTAEGKERAEAQILWQRRLLLSVSPLIFALLGCALVLRFNRGGRGFGTVLALAGLVGFYLVTLAGEQLTRTGIVGMSLGGLLPLLLAAAAIIWLFVSTRYMRSGFADWIARLRVPTASPPPEHLSRENSVLDLTTGIRDFDVVANVLRFFVLTVSFLAAIYLIFTAFELWKFAGAMPGGIALLSKYLFFLLPFLYLQLAPSAVMIAVLATFVVKSRANEIVTWAAAGQSIYRLAAPCLVLMIGVGAFNWMLQEAVAPYSNQRQDALRSQIRSRGSAAGKEGRFWVAGNGRIYNFGGVDPGRAAASEVSDLTVFEFGDGHRVRFLHRSASAVWSNGEVVLRSPVRTAVSDGGSTEERLGEERIIETDNPFGNLMDKPSHMNSSETGRRLAAADAESEVRALGVALHKKYSTPFLPFLIALFTVPFALSLHRRGKVYTIGLAVAFWLVYMAVASGFEQAALGGSVSPAIAVWAPLTLFTAVGLYLVSRLRT